DDDGTWTEYAGGYSDMVAQRGHGVLGRPPAPTRAASAALRTRQPERAPARRRLGFADQHALKTLPARIGKLAGTVEMLERALADPDLYRRDPRTFAETTERLAAKQAELEAAEEEWLRLEMLREETEGGQQDRGLLDGVKKPDWTE